MVGGSNSTWDFTSTSVLIGGTAVDCGTTKSNMVFIGANNFSSNMENYNVYIGVNGTGRTFSAGTAGNFKTYIETANLLGTTNVDGILTISGSVRGEVGALSIASNTASLDCSTGNFFTLTLVDGADTHVNPSNILPGQTINMKVTNGVTGTGTISFAPAILQPSGSFYTATTGSDVYDIVTFISFDNANLSLSSVKNFV